MDKRYLDMYTCLRVINKKERVKYIISMFILVNYLKIKKNNWKKFIFKYESKKNKILEKKCGDYNF